MTSPQKPGRAAGREPRQQAVDAPLPSSRARAQFSAASLTTEGPRSSSVTALLQRVRAEYLEMPGLSLTGPQAQRLFGLQGVTCEAVLAALVDAQFLVRRHDGTFVKNIARG